MAEVHQCTRRDAYDIIQDHTKLSERNQSNINQMITKH